MSDYQSALTGLFLGVLAVLVTASATAFLLARRRGAKDPLVENLSARVNAWWVMALILGLAFWIGQPAVVLLFAIASFAALREFVTLTSAHRADTWMLAALFYVALPVQYWAIWTGWYGFSSIFIPVYVFLMMPVLSALRGETGNFLIRVAEVQWAAMVAIYCVSYVPALLSLDIPGYGGQNMLLVAYLVIVVQMSDVLQYIWGKLLGRRKIAPKLSPSKTVEGFVGGVGSATVLGACMWWITPFSFWQSGLLALVIALTGFFGGLALSAVKRDRGVKDWGAAIAGHGGFMDRLDSLVFAAPVFFHLVRYWWTL